MTEHQC